MIEETRLDSKREFQNSLNMKTEKDFPIDRVLKNKVQIDEDDFSTVYLGALRIDFENSNMLCDVISLRKYKITENLKSRRFRKDKLERHEVLIWEVYAKAEYFHSGVPYVVKDGVLQTSYIGATYKSALREAGLLHNLDIPAELIDNIFKPIDEQVMDLYERAFGSKSSLNKQQPGVDNG